MRYALDNSGGRVYTKAMIKRVVVAGGRYYSDYPAAKKYIDSCIERIKDEYELIFVSGGCSGADELGERYAREHGYAVERYPADWYRYGNAAGPIRNKEMARVADYVICFWDGESRGTKSMIKFAKSLGKPVKVMMI